MSKIAFDLDGVLVPDYHHIPDLTQQEFYEQTLYAKPLFQPEYDYDIITARSEEFRDVTEAWLRQMRFPPKNIWMKNDTLKDHEYKVEILANNPEIKVYVESDPLICEYIRAHNRNVRVMHFSDFIQRHTMMLSVEN